jgi:hypothetical protein
MSEEQERAYAHQLQVQHMQAVEDVVEHHMLWCPQLVFPQLSLSGMIRTRVVLNDGRQCEVSTSAMTGATMRTQWRQEDVGWGEEVRSSEVTRPPF